MKNVLYQKTTVPASESHDGETPTIVYATEESNGFAVFLYDNENGAQLLRWFEYNKNDAIEWAVSYARGARS